MVITPHKCTLTPAPIFPTPFPQFPEELKKVIGKALAQDDPLPEPALDWAI
jgi:hypothetical protein